MRLSFVILICLAMSALGASYTSTQNGNWSSAATWGGSGPPGNGDIATVANTVTVDVNTTVGTSPNNTTTSAVIDNGTLIINTNITLTVRGNFEFGNFKTLSMLDGAALVFDNSASGGTPVYRIADASIGILSMTGAATSRCSISAISGQTWYLNENFYNIVLTNAAFYRLIPGFSNTFILWDGPMSMVNCLFDGCGLVIFSGTKTVGYSIVDSFWTNTVGGESVRLNLGGTNNLFLGNRVDSVVTYNGSDFTIVTNCMMGGFNCGATYQYRILRNNFFYRTNGVTGQVVTGNTERNYWFENQQGNPHFINPYQAFDITTSQNIFEGYAPDLVDIGDAIIYSGTGTAGKVLTGNNNIVLPSSYPATTLPSGTMLTLFSAGANISTKWYRNTANVDLSAIVGKRGMFAFDEGSAGTQNQIAAMKSNLAWGSSSSQGYIADHVANSVTNIITPSGSDYNWVWNTSAGNNQRGYHNNASTNYLWNTGDAVAAGVDVHQGTGNPSFYDSARNLAKWCFDRGYGTQSYTNGLAVLQADPTKIPDLIDYVFDGYRPTNAALRNAAHDGGVVGAANFDKTSRSLAATTRYRSTLTAFGL